MEPKPLWILLTALVFFSGGWFGTEGCLEQERIALLQLKSNFFSDPFSLLDWVDVKGSDCCRWERVECNITSRRVIGLDLNFTRQGQGDVLYGYHNVDVPYGYLNVSLFLPFQELKSLTLSGNQIGDFVDNPVSLSAAFSKLEILGLRGDNFDGNIFSS
ncbi:hypothetical protein F3Y22_tig00111022pilonHSYRG00048 [Hibiscus syriacus]|uniref:Leucine-rich repeat-containing N-terminal plant-type domain-containing protein n=1 Tax=Hibiscus syriacus TaxID=106335 RepID=A0A6A2Z534_HIBSY|nr:receptor-like protein 56 [Hibiscus syriacus]KAE8687114.1 hypothetical protein F3Y22_tig00111022pilonHSYRG00048 [Hibiscus syriacus]